MIRCDFGHLNPRKFENHPLAGAESPLWRTRTGVWYRIMGPMLPRIRDCLLGFGVLELALLVAILVSIARFKGITVARQIAEPADSSFCRLPTKKGHNE
jgi:hypothetical protein